MNMKPWHRIASGLGVLTTLLAVPALGLASFAGAALQSLTTNNPERPSAVAAMEALAERTAPADDADQWEETAAVTTRLRSNPTALSHRMSQRLADNVRAVRAALVHETNALNRQLLALQLNLDLHEQGELHHVVARYGRNAHRFATALSNLQIHWAQEQLNFQTYRAQTIAAANGGSASPSSFNLRFYPT